MRRLNAFTLIELLVVIAVIAVLMGILMPALGKAKNLAQGIACKGNMKNYVFAVAMYCDDNDGKFCNPRMCYFSQSTAFPVENGLTQYLHLRWCNGDMDLKSHPQYGGNLFRYLGDARAFICPTYKTVAVRNSDDQFFQAEGAKIRNYEPWYNYTMNAWLGSPEGDVSKTAVKKITDVKRPATTFSFCEESALVDTQYNQSGLNDTYMIPGNDTMVQTWLSRAGNNPWNVEPGPGTQFYDVLAPPRATRSRAGATAASSTATWTPTPAQRPSPWPIRGSSTPAMRTRRVARPNLFGCVVRMGRIGRKSTVKQV